MSIATSSTVLRGIFTESQRERTRTKITDLDCKKKGSMRDTWNLSIWNIWFPSLVQHIDLSWNQIEASLILMHDKLVMLGFGYFDHEMHILEPEAEEIIFHGN